MAQKYATSSFNKENMARGMIKSAPVSTKHCIEICNSIRGRNTVFAKELLRDIIAIKKPLKFMRFTGGVGHKKGMASGRYPVKAAKAVLGLIESVEANAQSKGLNSSNLVIVHTCSHLGTRQWRYGRQRRRMMKRTHAEVVVEEQKLIEKRPRPTVDAKEPVKVEKKAEEALPEPVKEAEITKKEEKKIEEPKAEGKKKADIKAPEEPKEEKPAEPEKEEKAKDEEKVRPEEKAEAEQKKAEADKHGEGKAEKKESIPPEKPEGKSR